MAYRETDTSFDDKDSDCYQVEHRVVSVVPLSRSYYQEKLYQTLKKHTK